MNQSGWITRERRVDGGAEQKEKGRRGLSAVARFEDKGPYGPVARFEDEGLYGPVARFEGEDRRSFLWKVATRLVQEKKSVSSQ